MITVLTLTKTLHILCGVVFLGLTMASYFYIINAQRYKTPELFAYALKTSFWGDLLQFIIIVIQFITGTYLLKHSPYSLNTPWIQVAYIAFSVVAVFWFLNLQIKIITYKAEKIQPTTCLEYKTLFHIFNWLIFILFICIVHDAIMHRTLFAFLIKG